MILANLTRKTHQILFGEDSHVSGGKKLFLTITISSDGQVNYLYEIYNGTSLGEEHIRRVGFSLNLEDAIHIYNTLT